MEDIVKTGEDKSAMYKAWKWLEGGEALRPLHWANIVMGGLLGGTNAKTGVHMYASAEARKTVMAVLTLGASAALESLSSNAQSVTDTLRKSASIINAVTDELKDPNIEGIPIHADSEGASRDVEVNRHIVIAQVAANKEVLADNATPQLKQWKIKGYLTAVRDGIDPFLVIKPSLLIQDSLLDYYATSRRPVWYKTHDCKFYRVLISHIDTAYDPKATNALLINVTLTEFKTLTDSNTTLAAITAGRLG